MNFCVPKIISSSADETEIRNKIGARIIKNENALGGEANERYYARGKLKLSSVSCTKFFNDLSQSRQNVGIQFFYLLDDDDN